MTATDPLAQVIQGYTLACTDPTCDVCNLGPLPGEARHDWLTRLKARFLACPPEGAIAGRPSGPAERPTPVPVTVVLTEDCDRCGEPRWRGYRCESCDGAREELRRETA